MATRILKEILILSCFITPTWIHCERLLTFEKKKIKTTNLIHLENKQLFILYTQVILPMIISRAFSVIYGYKLFYYERLPTTDYRMDGSLRQFYFKSVPRSKVRIQFSHPTKYANVRKQDIRPQHQEDNILQNKFQ